MNLKPAESLDPIFNALDDLIQDYCVYLYLVFLWLFLGRLTGKRRKRRKYARTTLIPIQAVPPVPKPAPQISTANSVPPASKPLRGPRMARIRLLDGTIAGERSPG